MITRAILYGRHHPIAWWYPLDLAWLLFGNEDDGIYGDATWRAGRPRSFGLAVKWWLRNPCHNLTWYVLGIANRDRLLVINKDSDAPGWVYGYLSAGWLRLPFLAYNGRLVGYIGWRPSGAFGLKLRRGKT